MENINNSTNNSTSTDKTSAHYTDGLKIIGDIINTDSSKFVSKISKTHDVEKEL